MQDKEISLILGTAGHIDHGKTTLIKAITGTDCDSLAQEKQRGITIELGFAPIKLPSHRVISVIDVPGHEKFIRQMVAGASGIDAVMLVVAADEGIMPQTREHLDILNLLGVRDGLVAVTKTDMVEKDLCDLAMEEVRDYLAGTFLEGCPVIPVSSITGENISELVKEIESLTDRVETRDRKGPFFMPVDRSFPVSGFGTVVTGTAYAGKVRQGEDVLILPGDIQARVRSIQVHGNSVEEGWAGQRVAMSLSGVSIEDLARGDVICEKGLFKSTHCFDATLKVLPSAPETVRHWQRVRMHIGTSDVLARVSLFNEKTLKPGESSLVQIITEEEIVAMTSERFIIRFYSPLRTIGGGEVVFPYGRRPYGRKQKMNYTGSLEKLFHAGTQRERLLVLVDTYGKLEIKKAAMMIQDREQKVLSLAGKMHSAGEAVLIDDTVKSIISIRLVKRITDQVTDFLKDYHEKYPHQKGASTDQIIRYLNNELPSRSLRQFFTYLNDTDIVDFEDGFIKLPDFFPKDEKTFFDNIEKVRNFCKDKKYLFPELSELRDYLNMKESEYADFVTQLKNMGEISIIQGEMILHRDMENALLEVLSEFEKDITLREVRDKTGSSRKYVLPVLEYLDSKGITRRIGDKRILRKKLS